MMKIIDHALTQLGHTPDKLFVLIFPHFRIPREHCIAVRPDKGRLLRTLPEKISIKKFQKIKKQFQKKNKKIVSQ